MRIAKMSAAFAAITLAAAPIAAQADASRIVAPVADTAELGGEFNNGTQLAMIGVVAAAIVALVLITDDDDGEPIVEDIDRPISA